MKERKGNRTPVPVSLPHPLVTGFHPWSLMRHRGSGRIRTAIHAHACSVQLSYGTGRNMQVRQTWVIRLLPARHTHETHVGHAGFRRGVAHSPPSGAAENRTRVWPAVSHRLPSRAYPTLDAHPRTGAFGEPARLVDDVHVLAGRIHRPTVRPVRSLVVRPRPFDRQMAESGLTRRA